MQSSRTSLIARSDTFFGVCEALGEDFRFNPLYLRAALGVLLLWNPVVVLTAYAVAGLSVAISRWLVSNARPAAGDQDPPQADWQSERGRAETTLAVQ